MSSTRQSTRKRKADEPAADEPATKKKAGGKGKAAPKRKHVPGVIAHITVSDAKAAVEFYTKVFDGSKDRMEAPNDGKCMHAEVGMNGGKIYLNDDFPEYNNGKPGLPVDPTGATLSIDVEDVDELVEKATAEGATVTMPVGDMFWGDRYAKFKDPFGHTWAVTGPLKGPAPANPFAPKTEAAEGEEAKEEEEAAEEKSSKKGKKGKKGGKKGGAKAAKRKHVPGVIAHITVGDGAKAIEFYKEVFEGSENRLEKAGDKIMHCELGINGGKLYVCDDFPEHGGGKSSTPGATTGTVMSVDIADDLDEVLARAEAKGATVTMPAADMFWGDRYAKFKDPWGHTWALSGNPKGPVPASPFAPKQEEAAAEAEEEEKPKPAKAAAGGKGKKKGGKAKAEKVPEKTRGVIAHLCAAPASKAIDFYEKVFGGNCSRKMEHEGKIMHAEVDINGGKIYIADDYPEYNNGEARTATDPTGVTMHLNIDDDVDELIDKAVANGATVKMPAADQFWGDRYGSFKDPFGHHWAIGGPLKGEKPAAPWEHGGKPEAMAE